MSQFDESKIRRDDEGKFATKGPAEEAGGVGLDENAPVRIDALGLAPGESMVAPESEHGDGDLEDVMISRDAEGIYWADGGPTVYFGAAVEDAEHLDRKLSPSGLSS